MRLLDRNAPHMKELQDFMLERMNVMESGQEQLDFLTLVIRMASGLWSYRVHEADEGARRECLHELGATLHAALLDNRDALKITDNFNVKLAYEGGHAHARFFINGALAGKLVVRLNETDVLARLALFGIETTNEGDDEGATG